MKATISIILCRRSSILMPEYARKSGRNSFPKCRVSRVCICLGREGEVCACGGGIFFLIGWGPLDDQCCHAQRRILAKKSTAHISNEYSGELCNYRTPVLVPSYTVHMYIFTASMRGYQYQELPCLLSALYAAFNYTYLYA